MSRRSPVRSGLPSALTVGAVATTMAVIFAVAVIGFTRVLPAINDVPVRVSTTTPAPPVTAADAARWSGVAQLTGPATCSGSLLDTGVGSGPAYLLTAGHCGPAGDLDANAVVVNQDLDATATFTKITGLDPVVVPVNRTVYSSMKGTDVSVLRLDATLDALRARGLRPYAFVPAGPAAGFEVLNVGVPVDGVDPREIVLRQGSCELGPRADLVESGWRFDRMQADNCPGIVGGSSGSPLFNEADEIVGMITTTTAGALPGGECALGTPCVRTAGGVKAVPDTSYGVSADGLSRCFQGGTFGLSESCPLPRAGLTFRLSRTVFTTADLQAQGSTVEVTLVAERAGPVRLGVAPLTARSSCTDPAVYTTVATATPTGAGVGVGIPGVPGFSLVCAAVEGAEEQYAAAVFQVDDTPPVRTPTLSVRPVADGLRVEPLFSPPELTSFRVKVAPGAGADCAATEGYQPYRRIPVEVRAEQLPVTVCVIGRDLAGNDAAPWSQVLEP